MTNAREDRPTAEVNDRTAAGDSPDDAAVDPDYVGEQDFAMRNVAMSNALPGGGQPAAGAIVGSEGRLPMQPETDEEIIAETRATDTQE